MGRWFTGGASGGSVCPVALEVRPALMSEALPKSPLFPATAWSVVRRAQSPGRDELAALEDLCRTYWPPVRKYLLGLGCPESEAEDVTQDFFASFLKGGGFRVVDPEAGKLRTLLKKAAANHLANFWRHRMREKRGGAQGTLALDEVPERDQPAVAAAGAAYDRDWALATLDAALVRLEGYYAGRGKAAFFSVIKEGLLRPGGVKDVAGKAVELGISEGQVRLAVHRARHRLGALLREAVAATLDEAGEVDAEVQHLLRLLSETL